LFTLTLYQTFLYPITLYLYIHIIVQSWSKFNNNLQQSRTIDEILEQMLFCNSNITFQNKPICFASFVKRNIKTINDIWTTNDNDFKRCNDIYNSLNDKRKCISEYATIKNALPKCKFYKVFPLKFFNFVWRMCLF
jgi:hypothetical protein